MFEGYVHLWRVLLLGAPWFVSIAYGPTQVALQATGTALCAAMFATACLLNSEKECSRIESITVAWWGAAGLSAAMGLAQYLGYAHVLAPYVDFAPVGQAYGNLRQRNQFATLMAIGMVSAVWAAQRTLAAPLTDPFRRARVASWAAVLFVLAMASAASGSRTGLVQVVVVVLLALAWRIRRGVSPWVLLAYGAGTWLLPWAFGVDPSHTGILGRLDEAPSECSSRLTLWSNVLHLIAQKPWLGWGWGELGFAHFSTLYNGPRFCEIMGNAHNLPLHLAVTLGLPVAVLVCGAIAWLIWRGKPWAERDATRQMAWSVLAVIGLHSMLEYPLWYGPFQLAVVLAVWILWCTRSPAAMEEPLQARPWQWGLVGVGMLALSYTAWDYWRISQIYLPVSQRAAAYKENTLEKLQGSVLFKDWVQFAELGTTPITQQNAQHMHALAKDMLHFSPEAMVVEKVIESARLLGDEEAVRYYSVRYQAAYPDAFAAWSKKAD